MSEAAWGNAFRRWAWSDSRKKRVREAVAQITARDAVKSVERSREYGVA